MPVAELGETGPRADIAHVVDGLARRILAELHPDSSDRLLRSAALSARSLAALKSFISGEYYFRAGDYASALAAFQQAVREDTAFALAHYRLSVVGDWASHPTLPDEGLENAVRFATGLPEYDQHLISALAAWRHGQAAEAMQLYRRAVSEFPGDVEAWYQLGEVIFHAGPVLGHSVAEARPAFERALKFRAGARESLVHLVRIASKLRDYRAVDSLTRLALAADSVRDATEMRLFRAIAIGDVQGRRDLVDSLRASPDEAVLTAAWRVGTFAEDFSTASDISRLLIDPSRGELYQGYGRWYVASLDLAAGRWRAARAALAPTMSQRVVASDSSEGQRVRGPASLDAVHIGHLGMMAALPVLALRENEVTEIERGLAAWADAPAGMQDWSNMFSPDLKDLIMGLLRARRGDTVAALGHAERLERVRGPHGLTRFAAASALTLRAEVARAGGRREEALALLERAPIFASLSAVVPSRAYERFLRAELLRDLGRDDEALRWYATQGQSTIPDLIYLAPAHLRQAEIHERRGDRAEAVADYRRFVELWSECDPELRPLVEDARRHLARLGTP
jgi:tetratricopeptide (TPR) repeat protein